jgi:uncharacterized membrane protein YvlD (DUF360 family)
MLRGVPTPGYDEPLRWEPAALRRSPASLLISLVVAAIAVEVGAWVAPGVTLQGTGAALLVAALLAVLNALLPPIIGALRLPFTFVLGFLLVLVLDAALLMLAADVLGDDIQVDSFWGALIASIVMAATSIVLAVVLGTNDDLTYTIRLTRRIARRQGIIDRGDRPGILFLEIDGLAAPILRRAMRDGSTPAMARWVAEDGYRLAEWEPDLSSQTGASQAGILLGSNEDIPAFRWVEKERGRMMVCSSPEDCAEIERRHSDRPGLLSDGGASRGNLLSGGADDVILTVSRIEAEKKANPGYRAFLANGNNVTRTLVLYFWEVALECMAALRAARRDVRPRGHRGGAYPFMRAAMCVIVRDLIVFGVLTDMMRGRPVVYATFSSYDEVAHHSGLERADTMEALRKLDQQFERIAQARRYAPRPYEIVVLSDHGQTQGATFKQRHGYGLDELVERSVERGAVAGFAGGDEQHAMVGQAAQAAAVRPLRPRRGRARLGQSRSRLPDGRRAAAHARGDRRAPSAATARAARASAHRLAARALRPRRGGRARPARDAAPRRRARGGRGPACAVRPRRRAPPAAHRRLRPRGRHHGRQLLRPRARRGLRVRGADLVPRRARRPADAPVRAAPGEPRHAGGADHRRGRRVRPAHGVAA